MTNPLPIPNQNADVGHHNARIDPHNAHVGPRHSRASGNPPLRPAHRWLALAVLAMFLCIIALACSSQSPNIGKYYKGRILHVSVADLERADELRWTTSTRAPRQGAADEDFFRLAPESPENELILLRVKVENHTATRAIVNIDRDAAQLRDFLQGRYHPIDVSERAQDADVPESADDRCNVPVIPDDHTACVKFLWNPTYQETQPDGKVELVERAQELPNGTGLDGWLVFEVPKDTQFRSFRWSSGDTVTIDF